MNWYTTKNVDDRNSDELIWIASLSAQCYNSGNATNLLSPVRYIYYWNRTFVALQDPDKSSTLYIDNGITQLVIHTIYPMFAIFVAKRIAVNKMCRYSKTSTCHALVLQYDDGWFQVFPRKATHHSPTWFLAHEHVQTCAPLAVGCLCDLWCFWCYTAKHDLSGSHRIGCTKGRCFGCVFLELNQFFTQHVGLGIVGFRWYSFSQMDVCWSLRCIHYRDKPDFVSFLPSRQGNFLENPMFWGIQWKQNHLYFGGAFGFNEHICIFAFWWMLSTLMYVGCVSLFLLSM